ncbi:C40 family peptidase [Thermolongibacillus altinsuensis]|uniref:C40 family peptidase n=1 Tax=Thermolongibacillus altinsuensis TaxID=575256 RepID=UPI00255217B2|nr:C40 family peptidase [Thermolongibacillus altinsuensis]
MKRMLLITSFLLSLPTFAFASEQNYNKLLPLTKKYIGVPYQFGGSSEKGFDCSGFTRYVMEELDVELARSTAGQYKQGKAVKKSELRVGDLVFFETYKKGPSHTGIYIGNDRFIHADSSKGVLISNLNDPYYWGPRYIGARRVLAYEKKLGEFHDVSDQFWAEKEIESLAKEEKMIGYEKSYFKPDEAMTRAEAAGMLAEYLNLKMNDRKQTFKDVPSDHWAVGAINALVKEEIISADDDMYRPDEALTREEVAVLFTRAFQLKRGDREITFTDIDPQYWAYDFIHRLADAGIAAGDENGHFRPKETVTRAQFAVFFYRAMNVK